MATLVTGLVQLVLEGLNFAISFLGLELLVEKHVLHLALFQLEALDQGTVALNLSLSLRE